MRLHTTEQTIQWFNNLSMTVCLSVSLAAQNVYYCKNCNPRNCLFSSWNLDPYLIHCSLGPCESTPKLHLTWFSCFCRAHKRDQQTHTHTHTHTDRLHYAICTLGNRPHLAIAAMWPNIMRHHNISSQCINSHIPLGPLLMYHCYIQPLTHLAGFCGFVLSK